jgi:hypothetical protein
MLGSQNTIENCLVHDLCWNGSLSYEGIDVGPGKEEDPTGQCVVRRNTVFNTGNVGIMVNGMPGNVIEYNHVYDGGLASKDVSLVYTHLPLVDGTVIRYNWVHDCHSPHIALGIRGDDQTRGLSVHHNVVWNCDWDGIVIKGDRNRVYHNTCFNNAGCDILVFNTPEPLKPWRKQWPLLEQQNQNTKTFNNCAAVIRSERGDKGGPPGGQASNNFEGDEPILENPASFDFRPKEGSPLVDAGRIIPGLTEDYQGSAPDIGAYENGGEKWIPGCNLGDKEDWPASGDARH